MSFSCEVCDALTHCKHLLCCRHHAMPLPAEQYGPIIGMSRVAMESACLSYSAHKSAAIVVKAAFKPV
eukprot:scaffold312558_cov18-Prasinocladus_malaysianus.AAC.1